MRKPEYTNSHALVIGIDEYPFSPLGYACSDACEFAQVLVEKFNFQQENVKLLLNNDASRNAIMESYLQYTSDWVEENDRIIFFYAGHGHTIHGKRGDVGYLVPIDGDIDKVDTLIRWDEFTRNIELISARHMLFIMDACYGGLALTRKVTSGSTRFLNDMLQREAYQVITAGKADQVVSDAGGPIPNHSIFTGHLLKGLFGDAAASDGIITANGVMAYIYDKVSKDINSDQTPHFGCIDGDGDFIFNPPIHEVEATGQTKGEDSLIEYPFFEDIDERTPDRLELVKEYVADPKTIVKLEEVVTQEIRDLISLVIGKDFLRNKTDITSSYLPDILKQYESTFNTLLSIMIVLARWGQTTNNFVLRKIITRLSDNYPLGNGLQTWQPIDFYPSILLLYTGGIAAISSDNYNALSSLLLSEVGSMHAGPGTKKVVLHSRDGIGHELFKLLPGHERFYVPMSEYLFKLLQPIFDDMLFIGPEYDVLFDRFEILYSLVYSDVYQGIHEHYWGPHGRFTWKYINYFNESPLRLIINEANNYKDEWLPIKAGLFRGSFARFSEIVVNYVESIKKLNW